MYNLLTSKEEILTKMYAVKRLKVPLLTYDQYSVTQNF